MGVFRVEASPNNRAGCNNKECKDAKIKIMKGEFRYAIQITIDEHQSWQYRHWGCVTPKQIANLIDACGGETDLVDGYDELPAEYQEKVQFALENKHIPDEDWKGDPEKNRPGQTGFRLTKAQAKKIAKEAAANGEDDDGDVTEEKPKKKRNRKPKSETEDDVSEPEAPAPKTKGGRAVKQEDFEEDVPAPKKRGRPSKKEANDDEEAPPPKKARAARGKKVEYKEDDDDEAPPPKSVKRKKSTVKMEVEERDDGMGGDAETEGDAEVAKPKPGRKKAALMDGEAKAPQKRGRKKAAAETD